MESVLWEVSSKLQQAEAPGWEQAESKIPLAIVSLNQKYFSKISLSQKYCDTIFGPYQPALIVQKNIKQRALHLRSWNTVYAR